MYLKLDKCPVCGSTEIKNYLICKDYLLSGESFAINECQQCTFRFTNPRPVESELEKYYATDQYISHNSHSSGLLQSVYRMVRKYTLKNKLGLINSLTGKGNLLDIGCGTGEFLQVCKKDGWAATGVEINDHARHQAEKLLDQSIEPDIFELRSNQDYNIITLWHVLEHLSDLHGVISHLKKLLSAKGFLVVALPNHQSYDARKYGAEWAAYDVPRHLSHFNQKSFKALARIHDLKIKNILPLKLDAYYISLLSEKYRNNRHRYIKSIINGLKSNSYAKKNHNEYSSLIYILKK